MQHLIKAQAILAEYKKDNGLFYGLLTFVSGWLAVTLQCLAFRDLAVLIGSNELLVGLILFIWLVFSLIGVFIGKALSDKSCILPFPLLSMALTIYLIMRIISGLLIPEEVTVSPFYTVLIMVSMLSSSALFTGALFGSIISKTEKPRHIYAFEGFGSFTGGILTVFLYGFPVLVLSCLCCFLFWFLFSF
jgi:hypothetical protein